MKKYSNVIAKGGSVSNFSGSENLPQSGNLGLQLIYFQVHAYGGLGRYAQQWVRASRQHGLRSQALTNWTPITTESDIGCPSNNFRALDRTYLASQLFGESCTSVWIRRSMVFLNPLFFAVHVFRFTRVLGEMAPTSCVAINGGYSADESCLALLFACKLKKIPSALVVLGTPRRRRWYLYFYDVFLDWASLRRGCTVVVNADHLATSLLSLRKKGGAKIEVVPNFFLPRKSSRKPPGVGKRGVVIGTVSRLDAQKGLETLLEAVATLSPSTVAKIVIVGDGPLRQKLEGSVSKLGISSRANILGYLSDSEFEVAKAEIDIMVLPSETEGGAFSLIEAMSDGFPVIASDIAAHREVITAGKDGLLFRVSDSQDLARVLKRACTSSELMEELGRSGKISSHSRFSVQRFNSRVGEITRELATYR